MPEDKQQLLQKITGLRLKKSEVEAAIGLPKNSLSAICSGKKPLPDKYIDPLRKYLFDVKLGPIFVKENLDPDAVKKIIEEFQKAPLQFREIDIPGYVPQTYNGPLPEPLFLSPSIPEEVWKADPYNIVREYCQEKGISPEALVEFHKNGGKSWEEIEAEKARASAQQFADNIMSLPVIERGLTQSQRDIRKKKLGY